MEQLVRQRDSEMLENREFFLGDLLAKTSSRAEAHFSLTMPLRASKQEMPNCLLPPAVVKLSDGKSYVQVVAISWAEAPAKHWSNEFTNRIKNDTSVSFD